MADTMTASELLSEVNAAISKIMSGGQSYKIGTRSLTRADLGMLRQMRQDLMDESASTDSTLFDRTSIAMFSGR